MVVISPMLRFCGADGPVTWTRAANLFAIGEVPMVGALGLRDGVSGMATAIAFGSNVGPLELTGSAAMFASYNQQLVLFSDDQSLSGFASKNKS